MRSTDEQGVDGCVLQEAWLRTWCFKVEFCNLLFLFHSPPDLPLSSSVHFVLFVIETGACLQIHFLLSSQMLFSRERTWPCLSPQPGLPLCLSCTLQQVIL